MKNITKSIYLLTLFALLGVLTSCNQWENVPDFDVEVVEGVRPIYATESEADVKSLPSRNIEKPGKIYVINDYLLVVDELKGLHIFDNRDSENPINIGFVQIAGSTDLAIRDNILYANQASDLLAIDVSNPQNIQLVSRVKDVFPFASQYPQESGIYFECPDPAKGLVVGWEPATLNNPECYK